LDGVMSAIESVTIGDAVSSVKSLATFVTENWGSISSALGFFFDKPDVNKVQDSMIIEPMSDTYITDIPDSNPSVSVYKGRYLDPGFGRMPMSKNWTVSDYSRIPALRRSVMSFDTDGDFVDIPLMMVHSAGTTYRTPLDYARLCSVQWRGSVKVCLQFFTSAFISARFAVQYTDGVHDAPPADYTNGLTKIINVKGDTVDMLTLPWLSNQYWETAISKTIRLKLVSSVASVDTVADPVIYCVMWVAGGDDIQFAFPRIPLATEWAIATPDTLSLEVLEEKVEAQAAIGKMFQNTFPPLGENAFYDIDRGFATSENLGPIADICKRYSPMGITATHDVTGFRSEYLDIIATAPTNNTNYARLWSFRQTFFGMWRACFAFRSGGYKFRHYGSSTTRESFQVGYDTTGGHPSLNGTSYYSPLDGMSRITVPQVHIYPFRYLVPAPQGEVPCPEIIYSSTPTVDTSHPQLLAARDDLQMGYPIIPLGFTTPS